MSEIWNGLTLSIVDSLKAAQQHNAPYRYWLTSTCFPESVLDEILALPFVAAELGGVSGKRELHNVSRRYFDVDNRALFPCIDAVASAFQDRRVAAVIERTFGAQLNGTYLRIELAQDVDGFWLAPHTDIGVKAFTFLLYLSKGSDHQDLGTDIYDNDKKWVGRTPYTSNSGMIFVPSADTYHGFERRPITDVRKLLVINYVTEDWRAREQLAYPDEPMEIGFNAKYLLEIAGQVDRENAVFLFNNPGDPTLVREGDDASAVYVVMPMRV